MKFKKIETKIDGLLIIEPRIFTDARGYFFENYNKKDFYEMGIEYDFVQDNQSKSQKGVLRGLHFQTKNVQGKLVRVFSGEVYDVAVDLRKDSKTFGTWVGVILSSENQRMFFIPPYFAHGFLVLSNEAIFTYKCTDFYNKDAESGIIYNDKDIGISWPKINTSLILSEKDKKLQTFENFKNVVNIKE